MKHAINEAGRLAASQWNLTCYFFLIFFFFFVERQDIHKINCLSQKSIPICWSNHTADICCQSFVGHIELLDVLLFEGCGPCQAISWALYRWKSAHILPSQLFFSPSKWQKKKKHFPSSFVNAQARTHGNKVLL